MKNLTITEHRPTRLDPHEMSFAQGRTLHERYGKFIDVQFPTPRTNDKWELTPKGYVGAFAVDSTLTVVSNPKVPVANLGRMLATVYDLSVEDFPDLVACRTLTDLYEQLAKALALRVLQLARQGLHHSYQRVEQDRAAVRGRLLFRVQYHARFKPRLLCSFTERTGDIAENRLPLWALRCVLRSRICSPGTQSLVRQAYRQLSSVATPSPVTGSDCAALGFNRLTERYRPAIALSRLILEGTGPVAEEGPEATTAFLLSMPALFERYVYKWLAVACTHRLPQFEVRAQERNFVGEADTVDFVIDVVLYDRQSGRALCVMDTKYKDTKLPSSNDVEQVGYYALLKGAPLSALVYPAKVSQWRGSSGHVETFRVSFDLSGDLDTSGDGFLNAILTRVATT